MDLHDAAEDEIPWPAFADVVTALLFVFIATTFWFMVQLQQAISAQQAELAQLQSADEAAGVLLSGVSLCLDESASPELAVRAVVEESTNTMSIYIEPRSRTIVEWFETCSAEVTTDASQVIDLTRACLDRELPAQTRKYTVLLTLEGHTDARPPSSSCRQRFPSNWELSGARAGSALRRLLCVDGSCDDTAREQAERLQELAQNRDQLQLIAAGRSDRVPAWRALCDPEWGGAAFDANLDASVCEILQQPDALQGDLAVILVDLVADQTDVRPISAHQAVVQWANDPRCAM